jgi:hypothetical protein
MRKPAFPTMSGGRNGTSYHARQTDLSPQRAPGALDLIAAVQRGDKIIMTFEEESSARFGALAVHPHAESSGGVAGNVTMTFETNSRKMIGWSDGSAGARIVIRRTDRDRVSIRVASSI